MATVVLGMAGRAIGTYFGGPIGGAIGYAIGSYIGGSIDSKKGGSANKVSAQVGDLRIPGTDYGGCIPYARGAFRTAGEFWWNTNRRPHRSTQVSGGGGGGKGGAPAQPKTETEIIEYDMDVLIGVSRNKIKGIRRVWDSGKLIFTADPEATNSSLRASSSAETWDRMTVYTGDEDQMPDPTYEAAIVALGRSPTAYRGRGSIFIQGLKLGQSGQVRALTFEVVVDGSSDETTGIEPVILGTAAATDDYTGNDNSYATIRGLGAVWTTHNHEGDDAALQLIDMATGTPRFSISHEDFSPLHISIPYYGAGNMKSLIIPIGIDHNGSVYFRTPGGSEIIARATVDGTVGFIRTVGKDLSSRGIAVNATGDLYGSLAGDNVIWRINEGNDQFGGTPSGPSMSEATGPNAHSRWARNPAGIDGRVYYVSAGTNVAYVDNGIVPETFVVGDPISGGSNIVVGDDEFVYVVVSLSPSVIEKRTADGAFVDSVTISDGELHEPGYFDSNGFLWTNGWTSDVAFYKIDVSTMTVVQTIPNPTDIDPPADFAGYRNMVGEPELGMIAVDRTNFGGIGIIEAFQTVLLECPTVRDVVEDICINEIGLTSAQINTVLLDNITKRVCSFVWNEVTAGRSPLEQLGASHLFDITLSGNQIKFVPRGGSAVIHLPYSELGGAQLGEFKEPLAIKPPNDIEHPAQIAVTFINISNDYLPSTEYSDRLVTATSETVDIKQIGVGMTPSEAKALADTMAADLMISSISTYVCIHPQNAQLEPTDPFTATGPDGSTYRLRSVQQTDSYPLAEHVAVLDDVSVLTSQGITNLDFSSQTEVEGPATTLMRLMDIPILQDSDDNAGFYVAARGNKSSYPGALIVDSTDNVTFRTRTSILESAILGTTSTALTDWTGGNEMDNFSSVTVNMGEFGILTSSTRPIVLNDLSVNLILIGEEILQFVTATLVSTGVYKLTGLLRGLRGTERNMTGHSTTERAIVLRDFGLRRIVSQNSELGLSRFYRGVTSGRLVSTATSQSFTNNAVGLKPFDPVNLRVSRDLSNNAHITWDRRTRLSTRLIGALGVSAPLGEESERYELDIYSDDTFTTVVDTLPPTTIEEIDYSAADQTAAGLTPGDPLNIHIHQMSAIVGRGFALEGTR